MLVSLDPDLYPPFVSEERNEPELLTTLYGTQQAALLFCKKMKKD
jgi:hypothetical protein